jgi:hypothetical protein
VQLDLHATLMLSAFPLLSQITDEGRSTTGHERTNLRNLMALVEGFAGSEVVSCHIHAPLID